MDEPKVSFSHDLLNKLEEIAFLKIIESSATKEQVKATKTLVRAFTKRGVPMTTIMEALIEISMASQKGGDNL